MVSVKRTTEQVIGPLLQWQRMFGGGEWTLFPSPEFPGVFQRGQYRSCPVASPSPRRCFPTYAGQSPGFTATSRARRPSSHRSFICDLPCHDTTSLLSEFILSPNSAEIVSARLIEVW